MTSLLKAISGTIKSLTGADRVRFGGQILPARHLRTGGVHFQDDAMYLESAKKEAARLQKDFGLHAGSALLEVGCSTGRLPIGILNTVGEIAMYRGVDVSETSIGWAKRNIQKHHSNFRFTHLNIKNDRYNPKGLGDEQLLSFEDESFDIIYLYSVFSHLTQKHVEEYLSEFHRLLKTGGKVFLTAFVEDNVADCEENPEGYQQEWKGALHCVRFNRAHFESLVAKHQLQVQSFHYGTETDGQSAYEITKI